jgi:phospholipid transport system substrate-binding protein
MLSGDAMKHPSRRIFLAALAVPLASPALAQATPSAVVEGFHATLIEIMRNAAALGARGRERRLRPVMERAFNLPAMTRIAVGPPWTGFTPAQQEAMVQAFSDWSIANYAKSFDGFGGESFETQGETAQQNNDRMVRTRLNRPNDAPVLLNYLLRQAGGEWRIVDIYLTGTISELASRRAEFTALLRDGGVDRLIADLRTRSTALLR